MSNSAPLYCPRGHALFVRGPCLLCAGPAGLTIDYVPLGEPIDLDEPERPGPPASKSGSMIGGMPTVAGYHLVREIGRGGMGVVYEARQQDLGRTVALKMILSGEHASPTDRERFRREAFAAASLSHPNIVQIYETGEFDGRPFFAMELVTGGSLADRLDGTPWSPTPAARLIEILTRAIAAAHSAGIVHRDLKPANVLITRPEIDRASFVADSHLVLGPVLIKVTDFGLAKRVNSAGTAPTEADATRTGAIMGTPSYLSPEQAAGRNREVGPAADVYALGALLYELLAGRPPFVGDTALEVILAVIRDEPIPPSRSQPQIPRDLETICLKCLEKKPERRYASAEALADDLRHFLAGEPIAARRTSRAERARKWAKRRPGLPAVLVIAAVALVAMLIGSVAFNVALREAARRERDSARIAETRRLEALDNAVRAQELRLLAEQRERDALLARSEADAARLEQERGAYALLLTRVAAMADHDPARALALLDQSRGITGLRDFTLEHLRKACQRLVRASHDTGVEIYKLAYDPQGRWLAEAAARPDVILRDPDTLEIRLTLPGHVRTVTDLCFSSDGRLLATLDDAGAVRLWELPASGKNPTPTPAELDPRRPARSIAFSPDGSRFAVGRRDGTVQVWRLGRPSPAAAMLGGPATQLYSGKLKPPVAETNFVDQRSAVFALAFSPDGSQLLTGGGDRTLRLWKLDGPAPVGRAVAVPFADPVTAIRVSPNGDLAAVVANGDPDDHSIRLFRLEPVPRPVARLRGHTRPVYSIEFNAEGTALVSAGADQTVRVWDLETRSEKILFQGHQAAVLTACFDPNGRRIATGGHDKSLDLWDVEGRRAASFEIAGRVSIAKAAVSSTGDRLAVTDANGMVRVYLINEVAGPAGAATRLRPGQRRRRGRGRPRIHDE